MKHLPTLALLLLTALPTYARLGETKAQCEARYGKSIRDLGDRQFLYQKSGLGVAITYWHDKASSIAFFKKDGDSPDLSPDKNKPLSEAELEALLKANSDGSKWEKQPEFLLDSIAWGRADLKAIAFYDREAKTLLISDQEAAKQIEEEETARVTGTLKELPHLRASPADFEKHLGKPLARERSTDTITYQKTGVTFTIDFWNQKAGRIGITMEAPPEPSGDSGEPTGLPLPDYLVQATLNATRENSKWLKDDQSEDGGTTIWNRSDEKAFAFFHADQTYLSIVDQEFADYEEEQENKQRAEKLTDFGGLGETKEGFEKRSGKSIQTLKDGRLVYHKADVAVFVTFRKEKAAQLVFFRFDPDSPEVEEEDRDELSPPEIEALLKGNGNRLKWTKSDSSTEERTTWMRADAQAIAVYKSEEKSLTIYDRDYIAHLQQKTKDTETEALDGF